MIYYLRFSHSQACCYTISIIILRLVYIFRVACLFLLRTERFVGMNPWIHNCQQGLSLSYTFKMLSRTIYSHFHLKVLNFTITYSSFVGHIFESLSSQEILCLQLHQRDLSEKPTSCSTPSLVSGAVPDFVLPLEKT